MVARLSPHPPLQVSVVIPARDAQATLTATLAGVLDQAGADAEVIVVDNGSRDATAAVAERHPGVRLVRRARGEGPGAARNAGAALARAPLLAFIDSDCRPAPGWLAAGVRALAEADLVQGRVLPDPQTPGGPLDRTLRVESDRGLYEAANLFVSAQLLAHAGGFPPGLEPGDAAPFGEDALFGWAARRAGACVTFSADALVYHAVFARGARAYLAERARLRLFPALVARVPELRDHALHRRWFLTRRSAAFDLALAGALLAAGARARGGRGTATARLAAGALATAPYARRLAEEVRAYPPPAAARLAAATVAADAIGAAALALGSVRARALVL
jgi:glycosyltransferase involved in cell wall biosynthesis